MRREERIGRRRLKDIDVGLAVIDHHPQPCRLRTVIDVGGEESPHPDPRIDQLRRVAFDALQSTEVAIHDHQQDSLWKSRLHDPFKLDPLAILAARKEPVHGKMFGGRNRQHTHPPNRKKRDRRRIGGGIGDAFDFKMGSSK